MYLPAFSLYELEIDINSGYKAGKIMNGWIIHFGKTDKQGRIKIEDNKARIWKGKKGKRSI